MDIAELKNRLQQMNSRTNKPNDIWKPRDEHDVRLIPYPHGGDSFRELFFHYEIGDTPSILCPQMNFGEECEICVLCEKLRAWKAPDGNDKPESERKADFNLFRRIQAKPRLFVPVVERGKEAEGPKFWGLSPNQAGMIVEICTDGERLAELEIAATDTKGAARVVFDLKRAFDLHVSFAKPGEKGNAKTFPQVKIVGKIKPSPLSRDEKQAADLLKGVRRIEEVYPRLSSQEVTRIFRKFVGSAQPEAAAEGGSEKYAPTPPAPTNSREDAKTVGKRSIDEAFQDLVDGG